MIGKPFLIKPLQSISALESVNIRDFALVPMANTLRVYITHENMRAAANATFARAVAAGTGQVQDKTVPAQHYFEKRESREAFDGFEIVIGDDAAARGDPCAVIFIARPRL